MPGEAGQGQGQEQDGRVDVPGSAELQGCAADDSPWAPAVRFIREEGPRLIRQLLQLPSEQQQQGHPSQAKGQGQGQQEAAGDGATNDDCGVEEEDGGDAAEVAAAAGHAGGVCSGAGVPSVVDVVCALVGAAPLAAVCQLLQRRPALGHVGEATQGPCCACPGADQQQQQPQQEVGAAAAAGDGLASCQLDERQAPVDGAAVSEGPGTPPQGQVGPPPCNSSTCCGPAAAARRRTLQSQAPAAADDVVAAGGGVTDDGGGGGLPGTPRGCTAPQDAPDAPDAEGPDAGALPPSVSETGSDTGSMRSCPSAATSSSSSACSSAAGSVVGSRSSSKESLGWVLAPRPHGAGVQL